MPPIFNAKRHTEEDRRDMIHDRLMNRHELDRKTGCWIYTGAWHQNGHALIRVGEKRYSVPKVAAWLWIGGFELTDKRIYVLHKPCCRNPACFNPEHLRVMKSIGQANKVMRRWGWGYMGQSVSVCARTA